MGGKWARISTTELLDTTNGCWHTCNNLPSPHQQMKAAIMNDKLYLLGGNDKDGSTQQVFVASLDTLSTHQLNWQSAPDAPWCVSTPVCLYNKFLLTIGGVKKISTITEVYFYNSSTDDQWKHLTNIPSGRGYPAVVNVAENILIIGGLTNDNEFSNTVWIGVFE